MKRNEEIGSLKKTNWIPVDHPYNEPHDLRERRIYSKIGVPDTRIQHVLSLHTISEQEVRFKTTDQVYRLHTSLRYIKGMNIHT